MSDTTAETKTERKPPTIADIVREKTGDGALIIDFFTDVMTGRIDGAELCHRIDAAKQLEKHKSKAAAEFLAKHRSVSCGHSIDGRRDPADPCSAEERSLVAVTLNAPATLTRDFLTVLSEIDEFLMARLIRAQTVDGVTIIEFLDNVMQDRTDGFKTHHRIAAAKEFIVHIVRDEQPAPTPSPSTGEGWGEGDPPSLPEGEGWGEGDSPVVPAKSLPRTRYGAGTQGGGGGRNTPANPARTEPVLSTAEGSAHPEPSSPVVPAKSLPRTRYGAGTQGGGGDRNTAANPARAEPVLSTAEGSAHPEPRQIVVPAEAGTHLRPRQARREPAKGPQDKARRPRTRRTRTQRRRDGAARAAIRRKVLGSERIEEEKDEKPAPAELTPAERRIREKLERHWHEPDPWTGPIDSTTPGRSPPGDRDPTTQPNSERGRSFLRRQSLPHAKAGEPREAAGQGGPPLPPFGGKIEMGAPTPSPLTGEGGACPELAEEPAPYSIRGVRVTPLVRPDTA